jgi:hypothetical protein
LATEDFRVRISALDVGRGALKVKAFSDWMRECMVVAEICALENNLAPSKADGTLKGVSDKLEVGLMCAVVWMSFNV